MLAVAAFQDAPLSTEYSMPITVLMVSVCSSTSTTGVSPRRGTATDTRLLANLPSAAGDWIRMVCPHRLDRLRVSASVHSPLT